MADEGSDARPFEPKISPASAEGARAILSMQAPEGYEVELIAAEPLLANPVAFAMDASGAFYVVETFRLHAGVTDDRNNMRWLDDDLAARTVEDRVAFYRKHLGDRFWTYETEHDRVRRLIDADGDGLLDKATVYADGFHSAAEGLAAGVLPRGDQVYLTCIPSLWLLTDHDRDGVAEQRKALHTGFGVHVGFLGHDLHGLIIGPDGRLYFSIGDRGLDVVAEGRRLSLPDTGCVLRCELDGSGLEVFAWGLRNPQELAFNDVGDLITVDNNSDSGDRARIVHVVEGGDSGWRIGYQFISAPVSRGPWNEESMWHPRRLDQPAFIVPPIANLADGPSGLAYAPGVGLSPERQGSFFLADFRGARATSGIRRFRLEEEGATYRLDSDEKFLWSALPTDVAFGPDGSLYFTDWVDGWAMPGKGRIYRVRRKGGEAPAEAASSERVLREGMAARAVGDLKSLLEHPDQRVRLEAQWELAGRAEKEERPALRALLQHALDGRCCLASRLHGVWGLGQALRRAASIPLGLEAAGFLLGLVEDDQPEVRAQAARALGDTPPAILAARRARIAPTLLRRLVDTEPRVRAAAATTLGRLGLQEAAEALLEMLSADGADPWLRNAAVVGLSGAVETRVLVERAREAPELVRLGILLVLRRRRASEVGLFLDDASERVRLEAIRAAYDEGINELLPLLAKIAPLPAWPPTISRRIVNALLRLGRAEDAERTARIAADAAQGEGVRAEAIGSLEAWASPSGRDRITGLWRPIVPRPPDAARTALASRGEALLGDPSEVLAQAAARALGELRADDAAPLLFKTATDRDGRPRVRAAALAALGRLESGLLPLALASSSRDPSGPVRRQAMRLLASTGSKDAIGVLRTALEGGETEEAQVALEALGSLKEPAAGQLLADWIARLADGKAPRAIELDLLEAARAWSSQNDGELAKSLSGQVAAVEEEPAKVSEERPLDAYRSVIEGGDAARGRQVFHEKTEVSCLRCHKAEEAGGEVGPPLKGVGTRLTREKILESIVLPGKEIAKGFESVTLILEDGSIVNGVLREESADAIGIVTVEGNSLTIPKSAVIDRSGGASAMPDDLVKLLTRRELRDLVEYLSSLR